MCKIVYFNISDNILISLSTFKDIPTGLNKSKRKNSFDDTHSSITPRSKNRKPSEALVSKDGEKWIDQDHSDEGKDSKEISSFDTNRNAKYLINNENELTDVKLVCLNFVIIIIFYFNLTYVFILSSQN